MPKSLWALLFLAFAGLGWYLLWGIGYSNGLFAHLSAVCPPDGSGLARSVYTGIKPLDTVLCTLISFFSLAHEYPPNSPFLTLFSTLLISPLLFIHFASNQPSQHPLIRYSPLVTGLACQLLGAAIAFPLWYALYALFGRRRGGEQPPLVPGTGAIDEKEEESGGKKAYFPTFIVAFVIPGLLMSPGHKSPLFGIFPSLTSFTISQSTSQTFGAIWQLFPITISILLPIFSHLFPTKKRTTINSFKIFLTLTYYSSLKSFYHLTSTHFNSSSLHSLSATFLPLSPSFAPSYIYPTTLPAKAHTFLLYDFLILYLSTTLWVLSGRREGVSPQMVLRVVQKSVVHGPGNALLGTWDVQRSGQRTSRESL